MESHGSLASDNLAKGGPSAEDYYYYYYYYYSYYYSYYYYYYYLLLLLLCYSFSRPSRSAVAGEVQRLDVSSRDSKPAPQQLYQSGLVVL